jgi:hypothetical protein
LVSLPPSSLTSPQCSFPLRPIASKEPYPNVLYPPTTVEQQFEYIFVLNTSDYSQWIDSEDINPNKLSYALLLQSLSQYGYVGRREGREGGRVGREEEGEGNLY